MKPLRTSIAFSTAWFDVLAKTMREGEDAYYSLRLPDYATVLALTPERKVLTVRQYRPAVERYTLELPSGIVDPGEAPGETAGRELLEETGYRADSVEVLGPMLPDSGRLANRIWNCFAPRAELVPGCTPEAGLEVVLYTVPELLEMTASGEFDHALHVATLLMAQVRGKI